MTVVVPLSKGTFALVDDTDGDLVASRSWKAKLHGRYPGIWYAVATVARRSTTMHSVLTGWPLTDHVNGNGLDNRRCNLREATRATNNYNSRKRSTPSTSRFKGVHWDRRVGRWRALIRLDRHNHSLGYHTDEVAAALAYDAAARHHFGEFAAVNFPEPGERSCLAAS